MAKAVVLRNIKRALKLEPNESVDYIVSGRVLNFRAYKTFNFIDLIDGSTKEHLQLVVKKNLLQKPELGSYLRCRGNIVSSPGQQQSIEFKLNELEYLGKCDPSTYPLATNTDQTPFADNWLRRRIHLRPRDSNFASLLRVRSELELSLHMIMKQMDFFQVRTPIITSNDSEASSDLFKIERSKLLREPASGAGHYDDVHDSDSDDELTDDMPEGAGNSDNKQLASNKRELVSNSYFNKDVFMITSAQLHLEALAASLSRVYCLSPTFRAESARSQRHLCEFLMFEAEESSLVDLEPLMNRVESIIKFVAQFLGEVSEHRNDFASLLAKNSNEQIYENLASSKFIRMTYKEALEIIEEREKLGLSAKAPGSRPKTKQAHCDLTRWHERQLLDHCNNVPIFITNYPKELKPFYMKSNNFNLAQCFDLIAPYGGEICGGSLREDDLDKLQANLPQITEHNFDWYLDLRKFGTFPHGGFGIGIERLIQSLLGVRSIRDTTAFPRWVGHCPM